MARSKSLLKLLNNLEILYTDLTSLIVEYDTPVPWLGTKVHEIKVTKSWQMATDQKYLYVSTSMSNNYYVGRYTLNTLQLVDKFSPLTTWTCGVDISGNELYVSDNNVVKVLNINTKDIIRQWNLPANSYNIKLHAGNLYCVCNNHIIYVYNLSGNLIKQFGKNGTGNGEFNYPFGIDIDDKYIYIADYSNHRIQVFSLEHCTYSHQWGSSGTQNGQFNQPYAIRLYGGLCYVGDYVGIQVFTTDGQFLSRFGKSSGGTGIGEFRDISGIVMIDNRLYVSEHDGRVLVLQ